MRINPINFNYKSVSFKQNNSDKFNLNDLIEEFKEFDRMHKSENTEFVFDDAEEFGSSQRNLIREDIYNKRMPYYSFYTQGRLNMEQLKTVTSELNKKTKVDNERLNELGIPNLRQIGVNSYRGRSLVTHPEYMKTLKEEGIERLIDLAEYPHLKNACIENGLDYMSFKMGEDFWSNSAFCNNDEVIGKKQREMNLLGYPEKSIYQKGKDLRAFSYKESRRFIEQFIELIDELNKGNLYIGCDYGKSRTDGALMLNKYFNPKWRGQHVFNEDDTKRPKMYELYKKLSNIDKNRLGFSPEFEKDLKKKLSIEKGGD